VAKAKYEVIAGIYKDGADESEEEEILLETDDLTEAQEFVAELVADAAEEESEDEDDEVPE